MAGGDFFDKILGTIEQTFQLDAVNLGPLIKNSSGIAQIRTADDLSFARLQAATPVDDQDVVTKKYADTLEKPLIVSRQEDTSVSIPNNTAVRGFVAVTTPGSGAAIGDLLYDDGSNSGQMEILTAVNGRTIAVTQALTGGTQEFEADAIYIWDGDGTAWIKVGDVGSVTGAGRIIRYLLDNTASQDSATQIDAGSYIHWCRLKITTSYSGGADIEIGDGTTSDLIMGQNDNRPQAPSGRTFGVRQDTLWPNNDVVTTTVSGSPGAGAGVVILMYSNPNG